MPKWRITYYSLSSGKFPVKDFIDELPEKYQTKVFNSLKKKPQLIYITKL